MRAKPVETEVRHLIDFQHLRLGGWKFFGDLSEALYGYGQVNTLQFWEVLANGSLELGKAFFFQSFEHIVIRLFVANVAVAATGSARLAFDIDGDLVSFNHLGFWTYKKQK